MFNDRLSSEEAKERIAERMKEAESYGLQNRLGYGGHGTVARWMFVLVILMIAFVVGLLL